MTFRKLHGRDTKYSKILAEDCPLKKEYCATWSTKCKYFEFDLNPDFQIKGRCTIPKSIKYMGRMNESNRDK